MTSNQNFAGQTTPSVIDTEYERCNFTQFGLRDDAGKKRGIRLFPGDDTPRTFTRCNLVNAEVPPGSAIIDCNTTIRESGILVGSDDMVVDGEVFRVEHHSDFVYGHFDGDSGLYVDLALPEEQVVD